MLRVDIRKTEVSQGSEYRGKEKHIKRLNLGGRALRRWSEKKNNLGIKNNIELGV